MNNNALELRDLWNRLLLSHNIEVCSEELKGCGILELKILKLVYFNSNIKIKDVLNTLNIPNSTVTNVINRLTKKELLVRELNSTDLRSFNLKLTEKGSCAVADHLNAETAIFESILHVLQDDEKETFVELFRKIVMNN